MSEKNNLPNEGRQDEALNELSRAIKSRERKAKAAPLGVVMATLAVLVLIVGGIWFAATYQGNDEENVAEDDAQPTCTYNETGDAAKEVSLPNGDDVETSGTQEVTLKTNDGDVKLEVDAANSPCTTNSFKHLVEEKFYDNTICHRGVKSEGMQLLQCGDPSGSGSGGPGYQFDDEYPLNTVDEAGAQQPIDYKRGTLAMANSGDNTNGSQFFLVTGDTQLPPKYNIFGTITEEGLKTLDKIMKDKVDDGDGKPTSEVKIESATLA